MTQPVLFAVDDDGDVLAQLEQALRRRYGADYRVLTERSPDAALEALERLRAQGEPVALLIADQWMPGMTGVDFLTAAHQLHPSARRVLLFVVMDRSINQPAREAMALGRLDGLLWKPWEPAEEHLYLPIGEQLTDWIRAIGEVGLRRLADRRGALEPAQP